MLAPGGYDYEYELENPAADFWHAGAYVARYVKNSQPCYLVLDTSPRHPGKGDATAWCWTTYFQIAPSYFKHVLTFFYGWRI